MPKFAESMCGRACRATWDDTVCKGWFAAATCPCWCPVALAVLPCVPCCVFIEKYMEIADAPRPVHTDASVLAVTAPDVVEMMN